MPDILELSDCGKSKKEKNERVKSETPGYKHVFNFAYVLTFFSQVLFSFAVPFVLLGGGGYLLEKKAGLGHWIFVCGIVLGALVGVYSMFRYILATVDWVSVAERRNRENDKEEKR